MNQPECNTCKKLLNSMGQIGLRTGGMSGTASFLFGNWADINEKVIYFDIYRCDNCGRLEFFDLDKSLPRK